jgi:hypothetical protein
VSSLSREGLYFVYCVAEDDEATDGCAQRDPADDAACGNNEATAILVEPYGRHTLDLTPPIITVHGAASHAQDALTVSLSINEGGTAWCKAVRDRERPPTANEVVAAGFKAALGTAGTFTVQVSGLHQDTEYDVYCFARDDGTKSANNDTLEVQLSKKNSISQDDVLATKTDAHVLYDSLVPVLLERVPVNNSFQVSPEVTVTLTFNEDVQAGNASILFRSSGHSDISLPITDVGFVNRVVRISAAAPAGPLAAGAVWRVVVPAEAVRDVTGNFFPGIDDGQYNLQT